MRNLGDSHIKQTRKLPAPSSRISLLGAPSSECLPPFSTVVYLRPSLLWTKAQFQTDSTTVESPWYCSCRPQGPVHCNRGGKPRILSVSRLSIMPGKGILPPLILSVSRLSLMPGKGILTDRKLVSLGSEPRAWNPGMDRSFADNPSPSKDSNSPLPLNCSRPTVSCTPEGLQFTIPLKSHGQRLDSGTTTANGMRASPTLTGFLPFSSLKPDCFSFILVHW